MKKYYNVLILPAVIVIAISIFSGFTNQNEIKLVENLLIQRTEIMQKGFYNQITKDEAEKQLLAVETYPLIKEDIANLRDSDASQIDIVRNMDFIAIEKNRDFFGYATYNVSISWDMSGLSEDYTMRGDYYVVLRQDGEAYKLSKFDSL